MVTGKVIRFDEFRGYGFVAPDTGGEDVFIHVNDLDFDKHLIAPGMLVEFEIEEGDRGLKASRVRRLNRPANQPTPQPTAAPETPSSGRSAVDDELSDVLSSREFVEEITEALLDAAPNITGEQIRHIRQRLVQVARTHGWIES